ncbi:MAG: YceD family protein [Sphingomonadaceae bacterium]
MSEFSRAFRLDTIGTTARSVTIEASVDERAALAQRFGLVALDSLTATATLVQQSTAIIASGMLDAALTQSCIASAEDVPAIISEPFSIHFVASLADDETPDELELLADDCDSVEHDGQSVDLGEAVAQSLGLALNPFPRCAEAARILRAAGVLSEDEVVGGAFAGLKGLLRKS